MTYVKYRGFHYTNPDGRESIRENTILELAIKIGEMKPGDIIVLTRMENENGSIQDESEEGLRLVPQE